jgi:hypothetical protein
MTRFAFAAALAMIPAAVLAGPAEDLLEATRQNDLPRVLELLSSADINRKTRGMTALHVASGNGYEELAGALVKHGADVDVRGSLGKTALMLAAQEGHGNIAQMLIDAGANTELLDDGGASALTWARGYGHHNIAAMQPVVSPTGPDTRWQWALAAAMTLFTFLSLRQMDATPEGTYPLAQNHAA